MYSRSAALYELEFFEESIRDADQGTYISYKHVYFIIISEVYITFKYVNIKFIYIYLNVMYTSDMTYLYKYKYFIGAGGRWRQKKTLSEHRYVIDSL